MRCIQANAALDRCRLILQTACRNKAWQAAARMIQVRHIADLLGHWIGFFWIDAVLGKR